MIGLFETASPSTDKPVSLKQPSRTEPSLVKASWKHSAIVRKALLCLIDRGTRHCMRQSNSILTLRLRARPVSASCNGTTQRTIETAKGCLLKTRATMAVTLTVSRLYLRQVAALIISKSTTILWTKLTSWLWGVEIRSWAGMTPVLLISTTSTPPWSFEIRRIIWKRWRG